MTAPESIRLYGTAPDSIVDGPGLRYAVFVQGCSHHCPGCHNQESQSFTGGTIERIDDLEARIEANRLIQGVTLSGGEPFEQAAACAELAHRLREHGLNIWTYSGYLYEDLLHMPQAQDLLQVTDVLVDGPFIQELHSYDLLWRGSSNQRVIDLSSTRASGHIVLWEAQEKFPTKPSSW